MPSAIRPTNVARVTMLMRSNLLLNGIRTNSVDLLKVQNQLSTGLKLARPSDNPAEATSIMHLDGMLERESQYRKNMRHAGDYLGAADSALGQAVSLLDEAYSQALDGLNTGDSGEGSAAAMAQIVEGIIDQMVTISNSTCHGSYIFGGQNVTQAPFESQAGGVLFNGTLHPLQTRIADDAQVAFSLDGQDTFGALSSEVVGKVDLDPSITRGTLLGDLNGALGQQVRLGSITVSDGTATDTVDLSDCVTVGDVIDKINAAGPSTITASIAADGNSLQLASSGGTVTVAEVGTGTTARDLGIYDPIGVGGTTLDGQDVDARLTLTTPVTALAGGAGIDLTSGLQIENSLLASVGAIDLAGAQSVEDILNAINGAGVGVRAEINEAGTGINVFNLLSGSEMTIGENGGTTASDLGIRSLTGSTALAELNNGAGVGTADGVIRIAARDGSTFDVALDGATTVQDVIDLINAAATAASVNVSADLAGSGNGIELTDGTGGGGNLAVTTVSSNGYFVGQQLGLEKSVASNTLTGDDVNPIMAQGVFSHLIALRDALLQTGTTERTQALNAAATALKADQEQLSNMHGMVGSKMRSLEERTQRAEDNVLALQTLRSDMRDIDFTEAITRYQNLYTALQGNLMTGSQLTNVSLLDFLK